MNALRTALLTLLALPVLFFGTTTAAQATGQPHEVNDDRVIGYSWTALNPRTMDNATSGAHLDLAWGNVLSGNDGCNDFWGRGSVNRETGTVTIIIEGMTRRACLTAPEFSVARDLEGTHRYYVYGDRLILTHGDGMHVTFGHR